MVGSPRGPTSPTKLLLGLVVASLSAGASAQDRSVALSYDAAAHRLANVSPALSAADHAETAARETAAAVATLHRPILTASAQYLQYQKTLSVDLTGSKQSASDATRDFLSGIPGTVPPAFQQIANDIVGRISQALPGLFAIIPDSLSYRYRDDVFRPTVQGVLPLYSGGAIPAIQRGAKAGAEMASARAAQARDLTRLNLIRLYFGQIMAAQLARSALESREALDRLLSDARKLEAAGVIPMPARWRRRWPATPPTARGSARRSPPTAPVATCRGCWRSRRWSP